jgi:hypothetical protein
VAPLVEELDHEMPASEILPPVSTLAGVAADDTGAPCVGTAEGVFRYDPQD